MAEFGVMYGGGVPTVDEGVTMATAFSLLGGAAGVGGLVMGGIALDRVDKLKRDFDCEVRPKRDPSPKRRQHRRHHHDSDDDESDVPAASTSTSTTTTQGNSGSNVVSAPSGTSGVATDPSAALSTALDSEVARATAAENGISVNLTAEISRATDAENGIVNNLTAEISRATAAETTLGQAIATESSRAQAAEGALSTVIQGESTRAQAAESTLGSAIAVEAARAQAAEQTLFSATNQVQVHLTAEIQRAVASESLVLQAAQSTGLVETTRAESAELSLSLRLTSESTRAQGAEASLGIMMSGERARALAVEGSFDSRLDNLEDGSVQGPFVRLNQTGTDTEPMTGLSVRLPRDSAPTEFSGLIHDFPQLAPFNGQGTWILVDGLVSDLPQTSGTLLGAADDAQLVVGNIFTNQVSGKNVGSNLVLQSNPNQNGKVQFGSVAGAAAITEFSGRAEIGISTTEDLTNLNVTYTDPAQPAYPVENEILTTRCVMNGLAGGVGSKLQATTQSGLATSAANDTDYWAAARAMNLQKSKAGFRAARLYALDAVTGYVPDATHPQTAADQSDWAVGIRGAVVDFAAQAQNAAAVVARQPRNHQGGRAYGLLVERNSDAPDGSGSRHVYGAYLQKTSEGVLTNHDLYGEAANYELNGGDPVDNLPSTGAFVYHGYTQRYLLQALASSTAATEAVYVGTGTATPTNPNSAKLVVGGTGAALSGLWVGNSSYPDVSAATPGSTLTVSGSGNVAALPAASYHATRDPVATDSSYLVGTFWYSSASTKLFVCTNNTANNAVWKAAQLT